LAHCGYKSFAIHKVLSSICEEVLEKEKRREKKKGKKKMEEDEGRQSLPLNIDMIGQVTVFAHDESANRTLDELLETSVEVIVGDEFATPVSILNGPFQAALLALLVVLSIGANACVINNIRHNCIKLRSTHFILIQHLCMADLIGASLILPAPLVTSFRGRWEGGSNLCHLSSVVNVSLWLQHVFMFLMLKVLF
jgi:hypothetical protein